MRGLRHANLSLAIARVCEQLESHRIWVGIPEFHPETKGFIRPSERLEILCLFRKVVPQIDTVVQNSGWGFLEANGCFRTNDDTLRQCTQSSVVNMVVAAFYAGNNPEFHKTLHRMLTKASDFGPDAVLKAAEAAVHFRAVERTDEAGLRTHESSEDDAYFGDPLNSYRLANAVTSREIGSGGAQAAPSAEEGGSNPPPRPAALPSQRL